ncbi:hypothetical protein [Candidatus Nephthysia bennettiae]|uniref:Uncharacterized protein n=1 Tax=Candidatus Nephthysia bennettiae TaxID=3127016 RepID=A0A934N7G8_9BACT|nr:hypothetical protein [Candidatus Dormibacteraeota bacterium]
MSQQPPNPPSPDVQAIDELEAALRSLLPLIQRVRDVLIEHDESELEEAIGQAVRLLNRCAPGQLIAALRQLRAHLESPGT